MMRKTAEHRNFSLQMLDLMMGELIHVEIEMRDGSVVEVLGHVSKDDRGYVITPTAGDVKVPIYDGNAVRRFK